MQDESAWSPDKKIHGLDVSSEGVDVRVVERFLQTVQFAHQAISSFEQFSGVRSTNVTAVITGDFIGTVQRVLDDSGQQGEPYAAERFGGSAVAKTMRTSDDYSTHTVVFDVACWTADANPLGLVLAAHEMSHVMLGRGRWASGALEGVVFPSVTPVEVARSMVRTAVEELRADILGGTVLGIAASTTVDGETRPARPGDLVEPDGYRRTLASVLDSNVYPGWAETVQRYRTRQIPLDHMWKHIAESTDQVLTLLAHCQAETRFAEAASGVFDDDMAQHRGVELYLRPTWEPILETVVSQGVLPDFADTRTAELKVLDVGEAAIMGLWERLGLTMDIRHDRRFAIRVSEPEL